MERKTINITGVETDFGTVTDITVDIDGSSYGMVNMLATAINALCQGTGWDVQTTAGRIYATAVEMHDRRQRIELTRGTTEEIKPIVGKVARALAKE